MSDEAVHERDTNLTQIDNPLPRHNNMFVQLTPIYTQK